MTRSPPAPTSRSRRRSRATLRFILYPAPLVVIAVGFIVAWVGGECSDRLAATEGDRCNAAADVAYGLITTGWQFGVLVAVIGIVDIARSVELRRKRS